MHEQMGIQHLNGKCALFVVLACFLVPSHGSASLKLARQGYSPITKTLLIANTETGDQERRSCLVIYDEVGGSVKRVAISGNRAPIDFAWVPGRAAFVVTTLEEVILFQKDSSGDGYTPTPIQCPGDVLPMECSWDPKGEWLVVNCRDKANVTRGALWLYRFGDKALVKTGVAVDHGPVTWNGGLLYGTKDNEALMVELAGGKSSMVRTIPLGERFTLFYGIFGGRPLFQAERDVRFGDKTLMVLDQPYKFRVLATNKNIFVSASSKCLGAFDTTGREIGRSDPGRLVKFGSVKDPDTVYGLADDSLVCLSVAKGALTIQKVADLDNVTKMGPDR